MTKATFVNFFDRLSSFIDWCCYYTQVSYTGSWEPLVSELPSVVAIDKFDCICICSFANTLTINNIPLDFMSCDLWIIFVCPIICNTVQYIHYRTTASWHVLSFDTQIFSRLIAEWSVENMNLDVTPYRMHIDVSVSPKKKYITNI